MLPIRNGSSAQVAGRASLYLVAGDDLVLRRPALQVGDCARVAGIDEAAHARRRAADALGLACLDAAGPRGRRAAPTGGAVRRPADAGPAVRHVQPIHEHMQEPELGYIESAQQTVSDASTPSDSDEQGWPLPWGGFTSQKVHTPPAAPQASPLAHTPLCPLAPHCNGAVHALPVQHGCPSAPQPLPQSAPASGEHGVSGLDGRLGVAARVGGPIACGVDDRIEDSGLPNLAPRVRIHVRRGIPAVRPEAGEARSPRRPRTKAHRERHGGEREPAPASGTPRGPAFHHLFPPRRGLPRSRRPPA